MPTPPPVSYRSLERPWLWGRGGIAVLLLALPLAGALGLLPPSMTQGQAATVTPTVAAVAAAPTLAVVAPTVAAAAPTLAVVAPTVAAAAPTLAVVAPTAAAAALPALVFPSGFRITSPTFPISGTAAPNSKVEVVVDGQVVGTATAGADGKWTIPSVTLPSGAKEMLVRTVDTTGKETGKSAPIQLSSLGFGQAAAGATAAPGGAAGAGATAAPGGAAGAGATAAPGGAAGAGATAAPGGAAGAGATAAPGGAAGAGATAAPGGAAGAGATAAPGGAAGTQATAAPGAGTGAAALPALVFPSGFRITSPTFPISGTAAPNSKVEVVVDGQVVGTATAGADGKWTIPSVTLPSGAKEMLVRTVDTTGKETGKSAPIQLSSLGFGQAAAGATAAPGAAAGAGATAAPGGAAGAQATAAPGAAAGAGATAAPGGAAGAGATAAPGGAAGAQATAAPGAAAGAGATAAPGGAAGAGATAAPGGAAGAQATAAPGGAAGAGATAAPGGAAGAGATAAPGGAAGAGATAAPGGAAGAGATAAPGGAAGTQATAAPGAGTGAAALPALVFPSGFRITSPTFPISGTAAPNSKVEVVVDGQVVGTATAGADGKWTIPSVTLPSGAKEMLVRTVDTTGKETGKSAPIQLSSLGFGQAAAGATAAPGAAAGAAALPALAFPSGFRITSPTFPISGTAAPNSKVEVVVDGQVVGTALVAADGKWSLPAITLPTNAKELFTRQLDATGKETGKSAPIALSSLGFGQVAAAGTGTPVVPSALPRTGGGGSLFGLAALVGLLTFGLGLLLRRRSIDAP